VIVGGGAAGVACAEALRAEGHRGSITIVNGEGSDPVDRPNLSKDYLAGAAPEEWAYLRTTAALAASNITVVADRVLSIDRPREASHARGRSGARVGCAPRGDRRRTDPASDSGRRPAACPYVTYARRQPHDR